MISTAEFTRNEAPVRHEAVPFAQPTPALQLTELDARGPTPPKPLVAIVAALEAIPARTPQYVRTTEAPTDLLRELSIRGVEAYPRQLPDGTWRTLLICGEPALLRPQTLSRRNATTTQT